MTGYVLVDGCEACRVYPMHAWHCTANDVRWGGQCDRPADWAVSTNEALCRWHKHTFRKTNPSVTLVRIQRP